MPLIQTKFGKANINARGYYDIVSRVEGNYKKKLHRLIYEDHYGVTLLPTIKTYLKVFYGLISIMIRIRNVNVFPVKLFLN